MLLQLLLLLQEENNYGICHFGSVSGISVGGQYALIAIGYTLVYGILRLINFAHGDVFMVAGLMGIYFTAVLPITLSIPLVILVTVALGFAIERVAYKPLRDAPRMSVMISAIGVSYLLQNSATYVTGGQPMTYPKILFLSNTINVAGLRPVGGHPDSFPGAGSGFCPHPADRPTKIGMAMRAVSKDFETSRLMGIKINSVISTTFIIGSALAAVGSVLFYKLSCDHTYGRCHAGLKAFVAVVFGGIGSIPGAVIGAFLIGICETIIKGLPSAWDVSVFSDAFTFALLIIILIFKPQGLFGEAATDKV